MSLSRNWREAKQQLIADQPDPSSPVASKARLLLFSLFLLFCPFLQLLVTSSLSAASITTPVLAAISQAEEAEPPDPLRLDPHWWSYFEVEESLFEMRLQKSLQQLHKLIEATPEERRAEADRLIQRIFINLKALPQARQQRSATPTLEPFADQYTLQEELEIIGAIRKLEMQSDDLNKEVKLLYERSIKGQRHLDGLLVAYLAMREPSIDKQLAGLEIIALRAALAIVQESLRVAQERQEFIERELDHRRRQLKYAIDHLRLSEGDLQQIEREVESAEQLLQLSQRQTLRAETAALGLFDDTPLDRYRTFLLRQKALLAAVEESYARALLLLYRAEATYLQAVRKEPAALDDLLLKEKMASWKSEMGQMRQQIGDWERRTNQEQERSLEPVCRSEKDEGMLCVEIERLQKERSALVQETIRSIKQLKLVLLYGETMVQQLQEWLLLQGSGWSSLWHSLVGWSSSCCDPLLAWLYKPLYKIGGVPITLLSVLQAILILVAAIFLSKILQKGISNLVRKQGAIEESSLFLVNTLLHYLILFGGLAMAISWLGISLDNVFLLLGAATLGVSLGLQNIANNFFSGLLLLFSRTLKVGDYIEMETGTWGRVMAINMQNTIVRTWDGIELILPNSSLIAHRVDNWTLSDNFKRLRIPFRVAYGTDKELVNKAAYEAASRVPCTVLHSDHYHDPQAWLVRFGENGLEFELAVWVNVYGFGHRGSLSASYCWELESALRYHGIQVPYPQREVRLIEREGRSGGEDSYHPR